MRIAATQPETELERSVKSTLAECGIDERALAEQEQLALNKLAPEQVSSKVIACLLCACCL